jgi:hypothetical protein
MRHRYFSADRGNVDNAAALALDHLRHNGKGAMNSAEEVRLHRIVKVRSRLILHRTNANDAGIIYQNVDAAEGVIRPRNHRRHFILVANIGHNRKDPCTIDPTMEK